MSDEGRVSSGCVFCGAPGAGVYYGHNTGRPFRVCANRLARIKHYGVFAWNDGKEARRV